MKAERYSLFPLSAVRYAHKADFDPDYAHNLGHIFRVGWQPYERDF